jgi:hypothetical protein
VFSVFRLVSRRCHNIAALAGGFLHLQYYEGSDFCPPSPRRTDIPTSCAPSSCRSTPNHVMPPWIASCATSASMASFGLRHLTEGSPAHPAESGSSSCRPTVRLWLLSTPPRDDAVTFGYEVVASFGRDFHPAGGAPLWAHSKPLRGRILSL